jgi:solute carrier family 9 (sodium/hydrogen exchanger), member 8
MLLGMIVGGIASLVATDTELKELQFQPELFFFLLLPPIIFEAGYTLKRKRFFRNFGTILAFAIVGTLISTFIIGFLTYLAAVQGLVPEISTSSPLQALMFGALISAVDPVATLAIMGSPELQCDKLLYSLVFGESVLNDAVAIVLFKTFEQLAEGQAQLSSVGDYFGILGVFLGISLGSVLVGVATGLLGCLVCKYTHLNKYPSKEITVIFLFAYLAYAMGEALSLSGIMSLFFCGIILSHYNWYNLSPDTQAASTYVVHAISHASETIVFAYVGLCVFTGAYSTWNWGFMFVALALCLIARAANIFPISYIANFTRRVKIPMRMQSVIWFAGLRGAMAFALAVNMPSPKEEPWNNDVIATTTLGIVIFTTVVCGGLTEPFLSKMGMKTARGGGDEEEDIGEAADLFPAAPRASSYVATRGGFHNWWKHFDNRFMRPCFGGERPAQAHVYSSGDAADELATEGGPSTPPAGAGPYPVIREGVLLVSDRTPLTSQDMERYQAIGGGHDEGDLGAGSGTFFGTGSPSKA